jgi:predicted acylesterase/phospholipase RssA
MYTGRDLEHGGVRAWCKLMITSHCPRRALVLEGGGAKGAYSFGALRAFKRVGLHFDGVAGTSVGALNAVLWSADALEEGKKIWQNLSFASVYPVKIADPTRHSSSFVRFVAIVYVLLHLLITTARGIPNQLETPMRALLGAIYFLIFSGLWIIWFGPAGLLFGLPALLLCGTPRKYANREMVLLTLQAFTFTYVVIGIVSGGSWLFSFRWIRSLFNHPLPTLIVIGLALFGMIALVALVLVVIGTWEILRERLNKWMSRISVLDSTPLGITLKGLLSQKKLMIPTWVTTSQLVDHYDPDRADEFVISGSQDLGETPRLEPSPRKLRTWIPRYTDIRPVDMAKQIDLCLGSAALPFGIVSSIRVDGADHVDGGMTDNCPLFPFQDCPDYDEIFVVLLRHQSSPEAANSVGNEAKWRELRRRLDVLTYSGSKWATSRDNKPPSNMPYRELRYTPRIVPFYPSSSLGNFFSGTLNFTSKYADRLMEQGYKETLQRLGMLGLSPSDRTNEIRI